MLEALNSDAGFDIEIYKNIKAGSGWDACLPVQQVLFLESMIAGRPFEIKDLVPLLLQGESSLRKRSL
jgi:homoserine kinase